MDFGQVRERTLPLRLTKSSNPTISNAFPRNCNNKNFSSHIFVVRYMYTRDDESGSYLKFRNTPLRADVWRMSISAGRSGLGLTRSRVS